MAVHVSLTYYFWKYCVARRESRSIQLLNFFYVCFFRTGLLTRIHFLSLLTGRNQIVASGVAVAQLRIRTQEMAALSFFLRRGGWLNECDGPIELLDGGGGDFSEN